ncbi:hypothetical protein JAMGFMIE_02673 [Rheinheimera sp. MM224]|nr:hypothetical protein JAMGFMIE_02673 [Rheinheimera sp. MM224]
MNTVCIARYLLLMSIKVGSSGQSHIVNSLIVTHLMNCAGAVPDKQTRQSVKALVFDRIITRVMSPHFKNAIDSLYGINLFPGYLQCLACVYPIYQMWDSLLQILHKGVTYLRFRLLSCNVLRLRAKNKKYSYQPCFHSHFTPLASISALAEMSNIAALV